MQIASWGWRGTNRFNTAEFTRHTFWPSRMWMRPIGASTVNHFFRGFFSHFSLDQFMNYVDLHKDRNGTIPFLFFLS
jgi:hypothetical protein